MENFTEIVSGELLRPEGGEINATG